MVLAKLFSGAKRDDGAVESVAPVEPFTLYPPRSPKGLDPEKIGDFTRRIEEFRTIHIAQNDHKRFGSLQSLDLEPIAIRFGRRWPGIREKAFRHIESCMAKNLRPNDLYVVDSETRVLMLMTGIERVAAERLGLTIASDITQRLCGVIPGGYAVRVKTLPFDLDGGLAGVNSLPALRSHIDAFARSADDAEQRLFEDHSAALAMAYSPTLDTRSGRIQIYHGRPSVRLGDADPVDAGSLCQDSASGVFDAALDKWSLLQTVAHLDPQAGAGKAPTLVVPVHFETLARMRLREAYINLCRRLPPVSAEQLAFEVLGVPISTPQSRMHDLAAYIKPFSKHLVVRVAPQTLAVDHFMNCGIGTLSICGEDIDADDVATPALLKSLGALARTANMRLLLTETSSLRLCQLAARAGVNLLNGPAFMPHAAAPGPVIDTQRDNAAPGKA